MLGKHYTELDSQSLLLSFVEWIQFESAAVLEFCTIMSIPPSNYGK